MSDQNPEPKLYDLIYQTVRQIPHGKVASYGQISKIVGRCSAQMVGFALAALPDRPNEPGVPWQRVINAQGKVSPHGFGFGGAVQRDLLKGEGVEFDQEGIIDFSRFGWLGAPPSFKKKGPSPP